MNQKENFAQRLKDSMIKAGYQARPIILEREFNIRYWGSSVSLQAVRRWLIGEAIPAQDKLLVLAEWLHVKPEYLRFGDETNNTVMEYEKYWHEGMAYQEKELFMSFLSLKLEQRKIIRDIISSYSELNEMKGAKEIKPKDSVVNVNKISQIKPS